MIPILQLSDSYTAKETIIFRDSLPITENKIKEILHDFNNDDKLFEMFLSKYATYELVIGDVFKFYDLVNDIYNENKDYYKELLANYNKQYDYALGNKRTVSRTDSSASNKTGWTHDENNRENKEYDLPNKQVNNPDGYVTNKSKSEDVLNGSSSEDSENTYNSSVTTTYDNEFLDLKRKYLSQIRNVYSEFADKFKSCFMLVFN